MSTGGFLAGSGSPDTSASVLDLTGFPQRFRQAGFGQRAVLFEVTHLLRRQFDLREVLDLIGPVLQVVKVLRCPVQTLGRFRCASACCVAFYLFSPFAASL